MCADYYELWFHFLELSVTNCADPDPWLFICNVDSLEEAVLSLRFEQPNLPPAGCNKPMDDDSFRVHIDMFRCSATSGRRQIPTSKGILSFDDPVYKTLPKPLQALARFAAVCNYLTANGNNGELWWKIGMASNGETQLELDVMYGVSIQSSSLSGDNLPQQYEAPFAPVGEAPLSSGSPITAGPSLSGMAFSGAPPASARGPTPGVSFT